MKNLASNRLLWVVLGVVFVAMLGMGVATSQMSSQATPEASPRVSVSASPEGETSRPSAPFLAEYKDPPPQAAPNTLMTVVGLIVKLAVVIGLIYLTILGLRYFSNRGRRAFLGGSAINLLEKPSAEPFLTYLKGAKAAPADVFKRIEEHRDRIRQRTAASLQETSA